MKYIFLLIFLLTLPFSYVYANLSVEMRVSPSEVRIWESLILDIEISGTEISWEIQSDIAWIENFRVFSRSQQMQFQSMNWETNSSVLIRLQLEARESGTFTLGPSTISVGENRYIDDTEVEIQILSETGISQRNQVSATESRELWEASNTTSQETSERELYGIIHENTLLSKILSRYWLYILIIILLSIILTFLLRYLQSSKKVKENKAEISNDAEKNIFQKYFWTLDIRDESQLFLKKYLKSSEHYLTERNNSKQRYTRLTLNEMKEYRSFQTYMLRDDFETLYETYYSWKVLSDDDKKIYIENIKKYLNG